MPKLFIRFNPPGFPIKEKCSADWDSNPGPTTQEARVLFTIRSFFEVLSKQKFNQ